MDPLNFGKTYGGMMVGLLLASLLCGVASVQTVIFFSTKRSDPPLHKISIAMLWFLDVLQLCLVFSAAYYYVVEHTGEQFPPFVWSLKIQIFMQTLIMGSTKFLYALRLWQLRRYISKWLPIALMIFLTVDYALGTAFAYEVFTVDTLENILHIHFRPIVLASMSVTTASDFIVGGLLIYTLAKSETNLSWTESSFKMLIAYCVNTGIITGFVSIAVVISYAVQVESFAFIGLETALPQIYTNCFLSMMNASVYFKTHPESRRPAKLTTHVLSYFRHDDSRSSHDMLASGELSPPIISMKLPEEQLSTPTINEIGLPLYKGGFTPKPEVRQEASIEVVVKKIRQVTASDVRRTVAFATRQ